MVLLLNALSLLFDCVIEVSAWPAWPGFRERLVVLLIEISHLFVDHIIEFSTWPAWPGFKERLVVLLSEGSRLFIVHVIEFSEWPAWPGFRERLVLLLIESSRLLVDHDVEVFSRPACSGFKVTRVVFGTTLDRSRLGCANPDLAIPQEQGFFFLVHECLQARGKANTKKLSKCCDVLPFTVYRTLALGLLLCGQQSSLPCLIMIDLIMIAYLCCSLSSYC